MEKNIYIRKIEDLINLRYIEHTATCYVYLEDDIDFDDVNSYRSREMYELYVKDQNTKSKNAFLPIILNIDNLIFNGNEHKISNIYINNSNNSLIGLFDCQDSTVFLKNIEFENVYLNGKEVVGIIPFCMNLFINNCCISGFISGQYSVGSFGGYVFKQAFLSHNVMEATVIGEKYVGGLVGSVREGARTINNSIEEPVIYRNKDKDNGDFNSINPFIGSFYNWENSQETCFENKGVLILEKSNK